MMEVGRRNKEGREDCVTLEPQHARALKARPETVQAGVMGDKIVFSRKEMRVCLVLFLRRNFGSLRSLLLGFVLLSFLLVDLLEEGEGGSLGLIDLLLDLVGGNALVASLALNRNLAELLNESLEILALSSIDLILELGDGYRNKRLAVLKQPRRGERTFISLRANRISTVGLLNDALTSLVCFGILLSIGDHVLNIVLVQAGR